MSWEGGESIDTEIRMRKHRKTPSATLGHQYNNTFVFPLQILWEEPLTRIFPPQRSRKRTMSSITYPPSTS